MRVVIALPSCLHNDFFIITAASRQYDGSPITFQRELTHFIV